MADDGPSHPDDLADRDRQLAGYATALADAVDEALAGWVRRCVVERCVGAGMELTPDIRAVTEVASARCASEVGARVRDLLAMDPDSQRATPLTIMRAAVSYPTEVLATVPVPAVRRDEFSERNFPDDPYDLTPAGFGDISPELREPGLVWGAAKAHVHLARRREEGRA